MNILLVDDKNDTVEKLSKKLASSFEGEHNVFLISDRLDSFKSNNFEIINILNTKQNLSIDELQTKYDFSIYKLLVTDRNITNYSTFEDIQKYSNFHWDTINETLGMWINTYDYLFKEKIDIVLTGVADNFKFNMAWRIAEFYNKQFFSSYSLYWWNNGFLLSDRYNQTSSVIDSNYIKFYDQDIDQNEKNRLNEIFETKVCSFSYSDNKIYPIKKRIKYLLAKRGTYQAISIKNLIFRKIYYWYSNLVKKIYINQKYLDLSSLNREKFILFPLHVMPEASLLGSDPELADQFSLIKNISMNMPYGVRLYIKEHPGQTFGYDMNHNFYNKLYSLPNVSIIRSTENAFDLMAHKNCLALAVLNGTLGLEVAHKFQKPVFVFGNADYMIADCFIKPKNYKDMFDWIQKIQKNEWKFNEKALWSILKAFDASIVSSNDIDFNKCEGWEEYAEMYINMYVKLVQDKQYNTRNRSVYESVIIGGWLRHKT